MPSRIAAAIACACVLVHGLAPAAARAEHRGEAAPPTDEAASSAWRRPPVSVRGGYTLDRGQVLLSYRFERVGHDELQASRTHVAPESLVPAPYQSAPVALDENTFEPVTV